MITTGQPNLDAVIANLEATCLGIIEADCLKAGEIATLKVRVKELEVEVVKLKAEVVELSSRRLVRRRQGEVKLSPDLASPPTDAA